MTTHEQQVGVVGLGLLGSAIAARLVGSGYPVIGHDACNEKVQAWVATGGRVADSSSGVFDSCDLVVLSLPDSEVVTAVLDAAEESLRSSHVVIDTTTGDPASAVTTAHRLAGRGARYVDATIAGSSAQLRAGDAVMFVGAEEGGLTTARGLLDTLAVHVFYLGEPGSASRFKLVHNLVLGLNRAALAEGLTFAGALGFDPGAALSILSKTPAYSRVMDTKGAKMVEGDYAPQARLAQHAKDVRLMLAEAKRRGARLPLSEAHRQLLERAESAGWGDADNSAIIEVWRLLVEGTA